MADLARWIGRDGLLREPESWHRLREAARANPAVVDGEVLDWLAAHIAQEPRTVFAALLDVAGRDEQRAPVIVARYRELMKSHPGPALGAAGYNLHEYNHLLDRQWIADARALFDHDVEGAWGIALAASAYAPEVLAPEDVDWFEARADSGDYFRLMFQLAESDPSRREAMLARALERFDRNPAAALKAASITALYRSDVIEAVLAHFPSDPESSWKFFESASYKNKESFDDARIEALEARIDTGPRAFFGILHRVADASDPGRARRLMERFARLLPRHPAEAIDSAYYVAVNDPPLLCPALMEAVCRHFSSSAYHAFDILHSSLFKRPELVQRPHVEAALAHAAHATNWAFGFFRTLLERRPEFTPLATLALFECLSKEPPNRAFVRTEELQSIVTVAQASHVRTALEAALRQPPAVGSRPARALMAILFRQKSRSKQHVLFEALRHAAIATTWVNRNRTPLWDFALYVLDHPTGDAISTAAGETLLEGAFQISYLTSRRAEHDEFIGRFDLTELDPVAPIPGVDETLHRVVATMARRFRRPFRLAPLDEFEHRIEKAKEELAALERADEGRRRTLEPRLISLRERIAAWESKDYQPTAREQRELAKRVDKALRAELSRIAIEVIETYKRELYEIRLKRVLGRDVNLSKVDASILPSFLFFPAIDGLPKNQKYLKRLIEDRIENRPHDWMWTEPAAAEWKERVVRANPGIAIERWRAAFSKEYHYRPQDASKEKTRRIREDLAQARRLLEQQGGEGFKDSTPEEIRRVLAELRSDEKKKPDPRVLEEVEMNLERARIVADTPESDYEGRIVLEVETDPFQVLFMGEYGFASCLSLRGSGVWSAVSNAIDVDKAIVWAKEGAGNVVGRRLIALTADGMISFRTYSNRHGLSLDGMFDDFVEAYARRCGTRWVRNARSPGPLLSDRWYDDGAL